MKLEYTNVNTNKLHDELIAAGIVPDLVQSKDGTTWITVQDSLVAATNAVVAKHDPTPSPLKKSEIDQRITDLEQAMAAVIGGVV